MRFYTFWLVVVSMLTVGFWLVSGSCSSWVEDVYYEILYLLVGCGLHPDCRFLLGLWILLTALGLRMFI